MAKLTIVRGLPGSGKTTWAKAQADAWRVNRDDIRARYTDVWNYSNPVAEATVTLQQEADIKILLGRGVHVIVDDTNLNWVHVCALIRMARTLVPNVVIEVKEFLHVPVEVCVARDAQRPNPVGEVMIMDMYRKHMGGEDGEARP